MGLGLARGAYRPLIGDERGGSGFYGFSRFYRFKGCGAAHKNKEAPRSRNNGDTRRSADSNFPFWCPVIDRRIANEKDFSLRSK